MPGCIRNINSELIVWHFSLVMGPVIVAGIDSQDRILGTHSDYAYLRI
jgi:hypothetical protein